MLTDSFRVRDKILGLESSDIDIAVEGCSGRDFAERALESGCLSSISRSSSPVMFGNDVLMQGQQTSCD